MLVSVLRIKRCYYHLLFLIDDVVETNKHTIALVGD